MMWAWMILSSLLEVGLLGTETSNTPNMSNAVLYGNWEVSKSVQFRLSLQNFVLSLVSNVYLLQEVCQIFS